MFDYGVGLHSTQRRLHTRGESELDSEETKNTRKGLKILSFIFAKKARR